MNLRGILRRPRRELAVMAIAAWIGLARMAAAQQAPAPLPNLAPAPAPVAIAAPGPMTAPPGIAVLTPSIPPEIQVVRFSAPEGTKIEILGPAPEPIAVTDANANDSATTVGLKVGVGYRLKLTNLPTAPGAELYPVVELVGHLHRPPGSDPGKFPIRIPFSEDDLTDAAIRGRLVTLVVYLESPEQAIPVSMPKDQIPVVTLSPVEQPLKVAPALGRVMAIVRVGGRAPTAQELTGEGDYAFNGASCPFSTDGNKCALPCGPVCGTAPPPGRPWVPRDEYLCDGGDGGQIAHFGAGGLSGIDPRDAVIRFQADSRPRVLPTNRVCLYAPRFAAVRSSVGANQNLAIENLVVANYAEKQEAILTKQAAKKFTQNQMAELARHRSRASNLRGRVYAGDHVEVRVLQGYDVPIHIAGHVKTQKLEMGRQQQQIRLARGKIKPEGIKTAESAVVTGLVEGLGQQVMSWKPQEVAGVEVPPNKPGLAVVKQVDATDAEPGDEVTFTIRYRNMGNVPIVSVSVLDSLLARLEYIPRSALGPAGTVFTANENTVGSTELRWDLPGAIAPGQDGYVQFKARVR